MMTNTAKKYGNKEIKVHVKNKCEHNSQVVENSLTFPTSKVQYSQANIDFNDNAQSFTLMNSFWFILASLLGQGVDLLPRYIWLFVLMFLMIELMKMIWKVAYTSRSWKKTLIFYPSMEIRII